MDKNLWETIDWLCQRYFCENPIGLTDGGEILREFPEQAQITFAKMAEDFNHIKTLCVFTDYESVVLTVLKRQRCRNGLFPEIKAIISQNFFFTDAIGDEYKKIKEEQKRMS